MFTVAEGPSADGTGVVAGFADATGRYLPLIATLNAALMTRTAPIIALAETAATTDPELAEHRDRAHATTRADLHARFASWLEQLIRARRGPRDIRHR